MADPAPSHKEKAKGEKVYNYWLVFIGSNLPTLPLTNNQKEKQMGIRFSIFGFAQERVMSIRSTDGTKELRLDVTDLLLLSQIADFPNRSNVLRIIEDDKIFFWMSYTEILQELPILNLKKQALRDRFDKLVQLGLLEKRVSRTGNMTFFRLTDVYETLRYNMLSYGGDNESVFNDRGVYSTTQGVCSPLHTISEYNNNNKYIEKEISKEKDFCDNVILMPTPAEHTESKGARNKNVTSEQMTEWFEDLWQMYERKGSKANAKKEFAKLTEEEIAIMRCHIPAYLQARPEKQYRQDFERYIKHKTFESVVYSKTNEILYDPESATMTVTTEATEQSNTLNVNGTIYR